MVEILRFFYNDIESIQMTLIYDDLKILSLLCSCSRARTIQASQNGLIYTLKNIIKHIQTLNEDKKFSQKKRIKLYKQILTLVQDNIQNGNDFTRNELIKNQIHIQMMQILQSSITSVGSPGET